jgi:hypothetical protein
MKYQIVQELTAMNAKERKRKGRKEMIRRLLAMRFLCVLCASFAFSAVKKYFLDNTAYINI